MPTSHKTNPPHLQRGPKVSFLPSKAARSSAHAGPILDLTPGPLAGSRALSCFYAASLLFIPTEILSQCIRRVEATFARSRSIIENTDTDSPPQPHSSLSSATKNTRPAARTRRAVQVSLMWRGEVEQLGCLFYARPPCVPASCWSARTTLRREPPPFLLHLWRDF